MSRWTAALFACTVAGLAACLPVHAADAASPAVTRFESGAAPDGKRLVLACAQGPTAAAMSCGLAQLADKAAAPRLSLQFQPLPRDRAYLLDLVREAVEAQLRERGAVDGIPQAAVDAAVLQQVTKNPSACVADEQSADVMLACPTGKRFEDAVVMLFRGLCDACRFQPIVVRKVN
jgi:hypothetical protein